MLRRVIAGTLAVLSLPLLYVSMWVLPEVAELFFFLMLIAPMAVWESIMEGHKNVES